MQMKNKTCLWCEHLLFDSGDEVEGASEYTPGTPVCLHCIKGCWDIYDYDNMTALGLRMNMMKAEKCPDFIEINLEELRKKVL